MKYLIVVVALVAIVFADEPKLAGVLKAKAIYYAKTCIKQEGVTLMQSIALREGRFDRVKGKAKCFAKCFLDKLGIINNGNIQPDVIKQKLGPIFGENRVRAIQAKCDSIKGSGDCDTCFELLKCYYENSKSKG